MRKLVLRLPKPVLFGLLGALGCLIGWALGEPLLSVIKPGTASPNDGTPDGPGRVAPVLVFNNEFEQRLKREEAQSGDVQISLMWDNSNDLDLHCIDPNGERVFFNHKRAKSGGELDVDMNAQRPYSTQPVENIFWPPDGAPAGKYRIEVNHYAIHDRINTTKYTVGVKHGDTVKELKGAVASQETDAVYEFEMAPESERRRTLIDVRTSRPEVSLTATLVIGLWTALLAVFASLMLVGGQNYLMRRPLVSLRQLKLVGGGGVAAGLISGVVSQYLFSFVAALMGDRLREFEWLIKAGQVVGWGMLGLLMGLGMGFFIPNLNRNKAGLAGLAGGVFGAIAFLGAMSVAGEIGGRLIGTTVLGFAIGLVVALVERLAREAALIVHFDAHERTVINLGPEPVILGSGREVHLYLPKERGFPEVTALVTFKDGAVEMDNRLSGKVHRLEGGNKLEIGTLMIEVQTDSQSTR
ncbi:MAG: hypothetical protein ISQ14_04065 [Verrucomicrobiae bacterium]|nr:hypothetical protein [Verrucomicrobiae bacterium]